MGLRNWLSQHLRPTAAGSAALADTAPMEREQVSPVQLAELEAARADLRLAIQESGVTSLRACTRDGSRWEENLDSVRAMTAAIRSTQQDTAGD